MRPIANETVLTFFEEELSSPNISYRNPETVRDYLARYPKIKDFIEAALKYSVIDIR